MECNVGFLGERCHLNCTNCLSCKQVCSVCKDGFYGDSCNYQCNLGCNTTSCHISNGYCECKPRHNQIEGTQCLPCPDNCLNSCNQSLYCDSCMDRFYGDFCNQNCSEQCEDNRCDRDGRCMCKVGYAGHPCQSCPENCGDAGCTDQFKCINCAAGFYSDYCNKTCSSSCMYKICAKDGSCSCEPGFDGFGCCPQNCEGCNELDECHACKTGHYGSNCTKTCPSHCIEICSRIDGQCVVCEAGFWGPQCSKSCSNNCLYEQCNQLDGSCPCQPGYRGENCTEGDRRLNNTF